MSVETHILQPDRDNLESVADALFRVGASFDGYTSQMRRAFSLNAHERLAIAALWSRGPQTMTDLGAWIPLSRAAVTTLVDRLEDAGLVRRGADGKDRRRTVVTLTEETVTRMRPVVAPWGAGLASLLEGYDDEEWAAVARFLRDFLELNTTHAERLSLLPDEELQALASARAPHARKDTP